MSDITAASVKALRDLSGAGMMDCKTALVETEGDMDRAIDLLRTKGLSAAAKKSGRAASEGLVCIKIDGTKGTVVEINSETDFVARNDIFQQFVNEVTVTAHALGGNFNLLNSAKYGTSSQSVEEETVNIVATIGENISIRRCESLEVTKGLISGYMHNAIVENMGKIGVLVALQSEAPIEKLSSIGKNLAMHICSADPQSLDIDSLDADVIGRERQILTEQAKESGKNPDIIDKMVEGRLRKFYEESVLLEQVYVLDTDVKVREAIEIAAKEIGSDINVTGYIRYKIGEGIEQKNDNFAEEVEKMSS
ncbi:MAG: translation elongation factor Ts [Alphaproteobacteria bacterium]